MLLIVNHACKLIFEKTLRNDFKKADLKINLVFEVDKPSFPFDGLINEFLKFYIDLPDKSISDFITIDDEATAE